MTMPWSDHLPIQLQQLLQCFRLLSKIVSVLGKARHVPCITSGIAVSISRKKIPVPLVELGRMYRQILPGGCPGVDKIIMLLVGSSASQCFSDMGAPSKANVASFVADAVSLDDDADNKYSGLHNGTGTFHRSCCALFVLQAIESISL
jgi:hypothetical protein